MHKQDLIIIGAGLSGLYLAWKLQLKGKKVLVLEARNRCGGRVLSKGLDSNDTVDLGPAWVWPQHQKRLSKLLKQLEIDLFKQFTKGDLLFENAQKVTQNYGSNSAHSKSYRIVGGAEKIINTLSTKVSNSNIELNTVVNSITELDDSDLISIQAKTGDKVVNYSANQVIFTIPPRLLSESIKFNPAVSEVLNKGWQHIATWMSSHCKIVFFYDKPFWRESGLSGEVFSQAGPLTEIYDGSPFNEDVFALTSFVGLNAIQRDQLGEKNLIQLSMEQLQRLFGDRSMNVKDVYIQDWAKERSTTSESDLISASSHPHYPSSLARSIFNNKVHFTGTETAIENGGYLEGAIESADYVIAQLEASLD